MRSVKVVLAVGLAALAVAIVLVLAQSPISVAGGNSVPAKAYVELERGDIGSCQPSASIPKGTTAIRMTIEARAVGPKVSVRVISGSRVLSEGSQPAGWGSAPTVTVPVGRLAHAVHDARICIAIGPTVEPFRFYGIQAGSTALATNRLQQMTLRMEYLRPGPESWWSLASTVSYHLGLGRAAGGTWIVFLALALMLAATVLASRLMVRELR
jgi:hypothetical protein